LEVFDVSDASQQARHEFRKSPPGKAGFRISGHLLGGGPLFFNQLQEHLAAVAQALALLEFVNHRDRMTRQLEQHFLDTSVTTTLAVESGLLG
jgi:hypothetical protein